MSGHCEAYLDIMLQNRSLFRSTICGVEGKNGICGIDHQ